MVFQDQAGFRCFRAVDSRIRAWEPEAPLSFFPPDWRLISITGQIPLIWCKSVPDWRESGHISCWTPGARVLDPDHTLDSLFRRHRSRKTKTGGRETQQKQETFNGNDRWKAKCAQGKRKKQSGNEQRQTTEIHKHNDEIQ